MIIVDSNVWIFAENDNADEHKLATQKVEQVLRSPGFATNVLIVSEVFHALRRLLGASDSRRRVTSIVEHPLAHCLDFSAPVSRDAMTLATKVSLGINDALIAQQALEAKAAVLTDDVKDFRKVKGLKVVPLR